MAGHSEGDKRGLFCSLRTEECPCGNKYKDVMNEGDVPKWGKYVQRHRTLTAIERSPEAHHVLPVASVTTNVTANDKIRDEVVKNTKWCVNDKLNMIALPLFEMTFTHYLIEHDPDADATPPPPLFAGLPMHNYGHAGFQTEVDSELKQVGKDAQENTKNHEEASKDLLAALNQARGDFMSKLNSRGKRRKGTHIEFLNAIKGNAPEWYVPFSMANKPEYRAFPAKGLKSGLSKKFNDLLKAIKDWSAAT